jgi:hypothetical protein
MKNHSYFENNTTDRLPFDNRLNNLLDKFDEYLGCQNVTVAAEEPYDYNGAIVYIIVITLFYSISVLAIIRIQTKKRTDFYDYDDEDEYSSYKPESVLRGMKNENITRQVLGICLFFGR